MASSELNSKMPYMKLCDNYIRFEPVSKITSVFFDETNKEILSVRSGGTLGVVVKGKDLPITFCMEDKGTISSVKFSSDHHILIVQRNSSSVQLFSYESGEVVEIHTQEMKSKSSQVFGFVWSGNENFVLIGDYAIELYQICKDKVAAKFQKAYSQTAKWFSWSAECNLLLLCVQAVPVKATFQPFLLQNGQMTKLSKFDVDTQTVITENDLFVGIIYGKTSVCVLRRSSASEQGHPTFLDVITQNKDGAFRKTHVCCLSNEGKFSVNIIDSLIVVHHQASRTSCLYDICLGEISDGVLTVQPVTEGVSVEPFFLEQSIGLVSSAEPSSVCVPCPLYAPTWVIFLPDIIIDARLGCMWRLQLNLKALSQQVIDKARLVDCLLRRENAKSLVLEVVAEIIESRNLLQLGVIWDKINDSYRQHLETILSSQMAETVAESNTKKPGEANLNSVFIDQAEVYSSIFAPLMEEADKSNDSKKVCGKITQQLVIGVILDYIRSLDACGISVQHFLYELVINGLVQTRQFYQLHQLLQYHVLTDSKPLACLLLSLVGVYEAGEQLSLDMLGRLNTAHDEIIEVLLSHRQVTEALRYARKVGLAESISARKFLEAALLSNDRTVFFSTFKYFSLRNASLRGNPSFVKGEHCDVYIEHFTKTFGAPDFSFQPL